MNKALYSIIFCVLVFAQIACGQTQTSNSGVKPQNKTELAKTDYPNLKLQIEELNKASIASDFNKVIDYTHPKVVEKVGGREKMIDFLKNDSAQMKAEGFEVESLNIGEIKQIEKIGNEVFTIIPVTMKAKLPQGKAVIEGSIIGISNDNGANWKFVNGINQEGFKTFFPKAAEKIQIPAEQPPKLIEN